MLRVATGSGTILIKADKAGIKSVAVPGFRDPDRPQRPALGAFRPHDPSIYVSAVDVLEGTRRRRTGSRGKLVLIGTSAVGLHRHQDHADRSPRHARRRDPRPGAGKRADRRVLSQPNYGIGARILRRARARAAGDRACADVRPDHAGCRRRGCSRPRWSERPGISTPSTGC